MKLKAELLYLILDSCVSPSPKTLNSDTQTGKRQSISQTTGSPDSFKYCSLGKKEKWSDMALMNSPSIKSWIPTARNHFLLKAATEMTVTYGSPGGGKSVGGSIPSTQLRCRD